MVLPELCMPVTVTTKGQVTIPKAVRDSPGMQPGSAVGFEPASDGRVVLTRLGTPRHRSRFAKLRARAGQGLTTDEIMALTRGDDRK